VFSSVQDRPRDRTVRATLAGSVPNKGGVWMRTLFRLLGAATITISVAVSVALPAHADTSQPPPPDWTVYALQAGSSDKCVEVWGWRTDDYAPIDQYSCHWGANQRWLLGVAQSSPYRYYYLQNINSGRCLDVYGWSTTPGAQLIQYSCHLGANQQWDRIWLEQTGFAMFKNRNSGLCLAVDGTSVSNFVRLTQYPCDYAALNQKFTMVIP
jgi:hypothetical protein